MKTSNLTLASAVAGAIALAGAGLANAQTGPAPKPDFKFEKCYGVSKAGGNDCQTTTNSCAGTAKKDRQGDAWIYLPAGACGKIDGGSTSPKGA